MGHGRYKSKNDLCPKNLLIHTDRILAWQGKTEKNVYSQVLVAIQGKHHQCGVDVLVLCVCSQWFTERTSQSLQSTLPLGKGLWPTLNQVSHGFF